MASPRVLTVLAALLLIPGARAAAASPGVVVGLGDSYMSGEAGRWRGNVDDVARFAAADALGPTAYWDTATGESVPGCHRSRASEVHLPGAAGVNLACSGATAFSRWDAARYVPGIDDGAADPATGTAMPGQLTLLGQVARSAPVGTVVVSLGGNDVGFGAVVRSCITAFARPWPVARNCLASSGVRTRMSDAAIARAGDAVQAALVRVVATMRDAGYADGAWNLVVQGYPRPVAVANRFPDALRARLYRGGCPFHDADIRWIDQRLPRLSAAIAGAADRAARATGHPMAFLDLTDAFAGRELCARGTARVDHLAPAQAVRVAERVSMVRVFAPFAAQESLHPNALGQQVLQACLRAALGDGAARSGTCRGPADWGAVDAAGLPAVRFTPAA